MLYKVCHHWRFETHITSDFGVIGTGKHPEGRRDDEFNWGTKVAYWILAVRLPSNWYQHMYSYPTLRLFTRGSRILDFEKLREIIGDYQQLDYVEGPIVSIMSVCRSLITECQALYVCLWSVHTSLTSIILGWSIGSRDLLRMTLAKNRPIYACDAMVSSWTRSRCSRRSVISRSKHRVFPDRTTLRLCAIVPMN